MEIVYWNDDMPKVTAIISAYYSEQFLQNRIVNLWSQDLVPEIIIVCQKGSPEHKMAPKFCELVLTDNIPNVYEAWNLGIRIATGDYITNANTDDLLYDNSLRRMANALDDGASVCFSDVDVRDETGICPWKRIARFDVEELKKRSFIGPMPMWKKSLHDKYGLFDDTYQVAGDWEFFLRVAITGEPFRYIPHPLGLYWRRKDSIEHRMKDICKMESQRIREMYK